MIVVELKSKDMANFISGDFALLTILWGHEKLMFSTSHLR